jgi:hypothetical protein
MLWFQNVKNESSLGRDDAFRLPIKQEEICTGKSKLKYPD